MQTLENAGVEREPLAELDPAAVFHAAIVYSHGPRGTGRMAALARSARDLFGPDPDATVSRVIFDACKLDPSADDVRALCAIRPLGPTLAQLSIEQRATLRLEYPGHYVSQLNVRGSYPFGTASVELRPLRADAMRGRWYRVELTRDGRKLSEVRL